MATRGHLTRCCDGMLMHTWSCFTGIDKAVSRTSPVQAVGVSSSLLSPRLSQQKYRVLCIKAKRSAVLPGPFDTLVDSNIESAVHARILAISKELTGAAGSGGQVTTRLGATLAKQSPVEHLAKALFEQMDLPMISMPSIRRAGTHLSRPFWGEPGLSSLDR